MKNVFVILGVGSNIEPEKNVFLAEEEISKIFEFVAKSEFIKTTPLGFKEQDDFLNGAFKILTNLSVEDINTELKKIEATLGRVRTENRNGPRTIDIDIVVYDGEIIDDDYYKRDFLKTSVDQLL